jgi:hypothetical protein
MRVSTNSCAEPFYLILLPLSLNFCLQQPNSDARNVSFNAAFALVGFRGSGWIIGDTLRGNYPKTAFEEVIKAPVAALGRITR